MARLDTVHGLWFRNKSSAGAFIRPRMNESTSSTVERDDDDRADESVGTISSNAFSALVLLLLPAVLLPLLCLPDNAIASAVLEPVSLLGVVVLVAKAVVDQLFRLRFVGLMAFKSAVFFLLR